MYKNEIRRLGDYIISLTNTILQFDILIQTKYLIYDVSSNLSR